MKNVKCALSLVLAISLMLALTVSTATPADAPLFIISNPYANVDWETFGQYRAGFHIHTQNSDGAASLADTVRDHFNKGFDIIANTDHDVLANGWIEAPIGAWNAPQMLTSEQKTAIYAGLYDGYFPEPFGPERRRTQSNGMISIPFTNEQSRTDHIVTLWADFTSSRGYTVNDVLARTDNVGGIAIIAHPGRETGGVRGGDEGAAISNDPEIVAEYVRLFQQFDSNIGMEIFNRLDNETRSDRILWDNILMQTMPYGRNVWGFSNDDSHALNGTGYNWNVMLLPELTADDTRIALEAGAFYTVARVDRRLNINDTFPNGSVMSNDGSYDTLYLLEQPTPGITNIIVGNDVITIFARDYDRIEWIADGVVIYVGNSLDLAENAAVINSYVRAQIISTTGVAMTQPFGVRLYGAELRQLASNDLVSIDVPTNIAGIWNGAPRMPEALGLPTRTTLTTARGWRYFVDVIWDLDTAAYNPELADSQTFEVIGRIMGLPHEVMNSNSIPLTFTTIITVDEIMANTFSDVHGGYWFFEQLKTTVEAGVFSGTGDRLFNPHINVTNAMLAQIFANIANADLSVYATSSFADVSDNAWYLPAAEWAVNAGVILRTGDDFNPQATISRMEMVNMVLQFSYVMNMGQRTIQGSGLSNPNTFMSIIEMQGLVAEEADGTVDVNAPITRAETAAIFSLMIMIFAR